MTVSRPFRLRTEPSALLPVLLVPPFQHRTRMISSIRLAPRRLSPRMVRVTASFGPWIRADMPHLRRRSCALTMQQTFRTNSTRAPSARPILSRLARRSSLRCPLSQMAKSTSARKTSSPYSACFPDDGSAFLQPLHALVIRPAAALGRYPVDDLIRIGDIAGLAVHAIREIDLQSPRTLVFDHFVDGGRAEILTRIAVFDDAATDANIRVQNM